MAINLSSNFLYQAKEFLDKRQGKAGSKEDLKNWNIPIPDGFEVFCSETNIWYTYKPTEDEDPETGRFHTRLGSLREDLEQQIQEVDQKTIENAENIHDLQVQNQVLVADTQDDLLKAESWIFDEINYAKKGIIVSVNNDIPGKNGIYRLKTDDYTSLDNWDKVSDDVIWVGETEPNQKDYIWIDQSGAYTRTTVNPDVADLIRAVQTLQKEVSDIKYAFSHEISFGDFTNNIKTQVVASAEPLEPGTTETSQTVKVPMPDGTVTTITTTDRINVRTDDATELIITTITKITDSNNSGGWQEIIEDVQINKETLDNQNIVEWSKSHTSRKNFVDEDGVIWAQNKVETIDSDGNKSNKYTGLKTIIEKGKDQQTGDEAQTTTTTELTSVDGEEWEEVAGTKVITNETWFSEVVDDNTKREEHITKILYEDDYGRDITVKKISVYDPIDDITTITVETRTVDYMINRNEDGTIKEIITIDDKTETETTTDQEEDITTYTPNAKHIRIKCGTFNDMMAIQSTQAPFLSGELLYCYDKNWLYIISPDGNVPIRINTLAEESGGKVDLSDVDLINFNVLPFNSREQTKYTVKVSRKGELECYPSSQDLKVTPPSSGIVSTPIEGIPDATEALYLQKLYINSFYCGGLASDRFSYNYCSHNFVELSNLTKNDINLDGISLQYSSGGSSWKCLPLSGTIKAGSTFLIRGGQCSVMEVNTTLIKVRDYDMEWYDFENSEMIKFSSQSAKFLLIYGTDPYISATAFATVTTPKAATYVPFGYIDLVGAQPDDGTGVIDSYEKGPFLGLNNRRLFTKYFSLDPVSQATKALTARNNANDWYYVELSTADPKTGINARGINVFNYVPKASSQKKEIFYNKTKLRSDKPELISMTFGIKATDYGQGATRCFNWVSQDYYDEFLRYKIYKIGDNLAEDNGWTMVESFSEKDGANRVDRPFAYQDPIYDRQRVLSTSMEPFTAHKYILPGLRANSGAPVVYKYQVGGRSANDNDHWSDEFEFTVLNYRDAQSFSFIQTSDQQGFRSDEYVVWDKAADCIEKWEEKGDTSGGDQFYAGDESTPAMSKRIDFTINTGDMTQNGNRLSEWLDYYHGGENLWKKYAQMNVIGNNDLCPAKYQGTEALGDGGDTSKINGINFQFFFTYEMDPNNKPYVRGEDGVSRYIHSLYSFDYGNAHIFAVNSEIVPGPNFTEEVLYGKADVYSRMRDWIIYDLEKDKDNAATSWLLCYCHEMPFTIITDGVISNFVAKPETARGGSKLNTGLSSDPYWFSRLLEIYGVAACFCGHKHTYSTSRFIRENYKWTWVGGENKADLVENKVYDSKELYPYDLVKLNKLTTRQAITGIRLSEISSMTPIIQLQQDESSQGIDLQKNLGVIEKLGGGVDYYTAPVYVMSQATGYKHTSNKELPGTAIPWLKNYYPNNNGAVNPGQRYPFYIRWTITPDYIRVDPYKIVNIFSGSSGKFSINNPSTIPPERQRANSDNRALIIKKRL